MAGGSNNKRPSGGKDARHDRVSKRYKELRKEGLGTKEAMERANREFGSDGDGGGGGKEEDPGAQVAAMFGMQV